MKKRIMVLCLVFIMMFGVSGCMAKESKSINELALEYMESKYGEPFEYVGPAGDSLSGTHELKVKCASLPDQILVEIENYREEERVFLDNYIAVKYKDETIDYLQNRGASIFGEARVFYDVREKGLSKDLPADASFQQYLADVRVPLDILMEIKASSFTSQEQVVDVANSIAANGTHFNLDIVVMPDNEYGIYDEAKLQRKLVRREFSDYATIDNLDGSIQVSWVEKGL